MSGLRRNISSMQTHLNQDRKDEGFAALKKGLAYCWSVAIVGYPEEGKQRFEKWVACDDRDISWIMKENLKKDRLRKMDREWTERMKQKEVTGK